MAKWRSSRGASPNAYGMAIYCILNEPNFLVSDLAPDVSKIALFVDFFVISERNELFFVLTEWFWDSKTSTEAISERFWSNLEKTISETFGTVRDNTDDCRILWSISEKSSAILRGKSCDCFPFLDLYLSERGTESLFAFLTMLYLQHNDFGAKTSTFGIPKFIFHRNHCQTPSKIETGRNPAVFYCCLGWRDRMGWCWP